MMRKTVRIYAAVLIAALAGCQKQPDAPVQAPEGELVPVRLFLDVDGAEPDVKGVTPVNDEKGSEVPVAIQNVWVAQFNGTDPQTALMACTPVYVSSYSNGSPVILNKDLGGVSTIVFIANTFNPYLSLGEAGKTTMADFKKKFIPVSGEESLFGVHGVNYYQRLSGATTATINGVMDIGSALSPIHLKRNIARVDITVNNSTSTNPLVIDKVRLCSVPVKDYIYVNYLAGDSFPAIFPKDIAEVIDYDADSWTSGTSNDFRYYLPVNQRGTGDGTYASAKGSEAPHGATYFRISAHTAGSPSDAVDFTFYLGAALGTSDGTGSAVDYNLAANHSYSYTFNITDDWLSKIGGADGRVSYFPSEVDFTLSSFERPNCYILATPDDPTRFITFKIPVEKADMFWADGDYSKKPSTSQDIEVRHYGASVFYSRDMVIGASGAWSADIIWADFDPAGKFSVEKSSGTGNTDFFTVKVYGGFSGNVVVGLKKLLQPEPGKGDTWSNLPCYVWSWHFWIGDYDPSQLPASPPADKYIYKVRGGKVVRYALTDQFMMDRPLGATYDTSDPTFRYSVGMSAGRTDTTLGMYYQFGRKDPFPNDRPLYYHGSSTATFTYYEIKAENAESILYSDATMAKVRINNLTHANNPLMYTPNKKLNVPFSINHPMTYIYDGRSWNVGEGDYDDYFNPKTYVSGIIWMDPKAAGRTDPALNVKWGVQKSVFDPCPMGWKLPTEVSASGNWKLASGSWAVADHKSTASYLNVWNEDTVYGCYLWPEAKPSTITEADLDRADLYPFGGYMIYSSGEVSSNIDASAPSNRLSLYWTSKLSSNIYGSSLSLGMNNYGAQNSYHTQGYNVRCVKY